jgi:hypothetical protein
MSDHDPYVAAPSERPAPGELDRLRPWLASAVLVLVLGAWAAVVLVDAQQDPTLQFPTDGPTDLDAPADPGTPGTSPQIPTLPDD